MSLIQALVLGLFQGISEFLPISSSGHLRLMRDLFGLSGVPRLFDVVLHLATLLSVLLVFRRRVGGIMGALYRRAFRRRDTSPSDPENLALIAPALSATAVTAAVGLGMERWLAVDSPRTISALFLVTAVLLLASSRFRGVRTYGRFGAVRGALIGLAQGIGVLPGISRSGITISAGLAAGLDRGTAGEFSFLLAIPAILGAFLLELRNAAELGREVGALPLAVGFTAAFAAGTAALLVLMPIVRRGKLSWFAVYLIPAGITGLFLFR
ncbi:MAG TPA: undecaprenyl-diphosphate phosphatase [Magnetospirillaceae bacterium]|nr:undecaprenyl-diphosphate phosphatase [Magnetospirillaceae bacterium]